MKQLIQNLKDGHLEQEEGLSYWLLGGKDYEFRDLGIEIHRLHRFSQING